MKNPTWLERFKERKIGQALAVYLGSAWVFIEALNFLIEKYGWEVRVLDTIIILVIFGLPALLIYIWFKTKFTKKAIVLQTINIIIAFSVIGYGYLRPGSIDPRQLRLIKSENSKKQLAESIQSLAVLPFDNYTGNDEFEYYVAGMHDGLIVDLGKIKALRVISKTSSRVFKGTMMSIPEIASELNVDAVIEASVSCIEGDSVCIRIKLVSAFPEEQQLWVQDYYEDKSQIPNLLNRVTKQISEEINIVLTPQEESLLAESRTVDTEAYDAYLKGQYYWSRLSKEGLQKAMDYFNIAIEKDPDWVPPYAGLAEVWIGRMQMGFAAPSIAIPKIYEYINKALDLDPNSANSHYVNALIAVWTEWAWEKGEREFLKVLEFNPNDAMCRIYYAHLLMILHRSDEALYQANLALELDPLRPLVLGLYAAVMKHTGDPQSAITHAEKALSIDPDNRFAKSQLSGAYHRSGDYERWFEYWKTVAWWDDEVIASIEKVFHEHGYLAAVEETIKVNEEVKKNGGRISEMGQAQRYFAVKKYDKALDYLEKAYEMHNPNMPYISLYHYDQLREHPRFIELLKKMNLPL